MLISLFKNYYKKYKIDIAVVLFLFSLATIFFSGILFNTKVLFPAPDIQGQYLSWRSFLVDQVIHHHRLPLWNPYEYGGTTFIGNPLSAIFYPLNVIFYIFDVGQAFKYLFFIDVFLIGVFTYLYAKLIIKSRGASIFSAITMMFNGVIVARINAGHISNVDTLIWFPLLLFFVELNIRKASVKISAVLGIVVALTILAGHIQFAVYSLFATAFYFFLRALYEYRENNKFVMKKQIYLVILAFVIGLSISSIQLLPVLEFGQFSNRSKITYEFASNFSIPIPQMLQLFLPRIFGQPQLNFAWGRGNFWEFTAYSGIIAYALVLITLFFKRNKIVNTLIILCLFSILFALGSYGPIYKLFYNFIPGFNHFRIPATMLFVFSFSIAILSGFGFQTLFSVLQNKQFAKIRKIILRINFLVIVSGLLICLNIQGVSNYLANIISHKFAINEGTFSNLLRVDLMVIVVMFVVISVIIFLRQQAMLAKAILITFAIFDLFFFGVPLLTTSNSYIRNDYKQMINRIDRNYRVIDLANITPIILQQKNIEQVRSYSPALSVDFRDYLWSTSEHLNLPYEPFIGIESIKNYNLLRLLNVKYILSQKRLVNENIRVLGYESGVYLFEISNPAPKAFTVPDAIIVDKSIILKSLTSKDFHLNKTLLLSDSYVLKRSEDSRSREVAYFDKSPNEITLSANSPTSEYLFLSEIWYPGWKAYVNGKETQILKTDYIFRSIHLEKGTNFIVLRFEPLAFMFGKYFFIVGITICFLILKNDIWRLTFHLHVRKWLRSLTK